MYVSVPFCRAKCSFCNFASGVSSTEAIERYVSMLCAEIESASENAEQLRATLPRDVDTVYFGGGTPSLLSPQQFRKIFAALRVDFDLRADAEITLEAAPGQITDDVLHEVMQLGVNRVSLGVQSFVDRESAAVGRTHTGASCLAEIARLQAAGIWDVGVDVIAGLPYQTDDSWEESLQAAAGAALTHLSVYMLEIDEDSRLGREVLAGGLRLHAPRVADEDAVARRYERACEFLPPNGFGQYEISNFAKAGFEARHNRKYWERKPYVGFGLDAHSMLRRNDDAVRCANPDELGLYAGARSWREITEVGLRDAFEETLFLGLRMLRGVEQEDLFVAYPEQWIAEAAEAAAELAREGLMIVDDSKWRLTLRGRLLSNDVFGHLLAGVNA